jgi:glycosidase
MEFSMTTPERLIGTDRPESIRAAREVLSRAGSVVDYTPSPADWRNEVLYFLLPDRFSDGQEAARPLLSRNEIRALRAGQSRPSWDWRDWAESGKRWQGGTLQGLRGRLEYLQQLGVTAIWIGPVFKQRARLDTYHGYGIQDFLDVDERFGDRRDLLELVAAAHDRQMRVILDIIVNHSGDNWAYVPPGRPLEEGRNEPPYRPWPSYYGDPGNAETGGWQLAWRNEQQVAFTTNGNDLQGLHDGVWPREMQASPSYTRAGKGDLGAGRIDDPHAEHKRTDFLALKDLALDVGVALSDLVACYQYWIALTDIDGFRIDTVKHMSLAEARNFCGAIREYADTLGKQNFLLVAEIAGGDDYQDFVLDNLAILQRNLSAALDIGSARLNLTAAAKGDSPGATYLASFDEASQGFESHRAFGNRHVSILDDHDHVFGQKIRFSAQLPDDSPVKDYHVTVATALQLFTLGIPCIYYGTEQAFAGPAQSQLRYLYAEGWNASDNWADRYLRETMFGPEHPRAHHEQPLETQVSARDELLPGFGPFGTAGRHCFDTDSPSYVRIAALCAARAAHQVLRIGRQYPRQVRLPHSWFVFPAAGELVAWSRILGAHEAVVLVNPHTQESRGGDVVIAAELSPPGTEYVVVANTAQAAASAGAYAGSHPVGERLVVRGQTFPEEPAYLQIRDVRPAEVIVLVREQA